MQIRFGIITALIVLFGVLGVAVYFKKYAALFLIALVGVLLLIIVVTVALFSLLYYNVDGLIQANSVLRRSLTVVGSHRHRLSNTELHRVRVFLRRSLRDILLFGVLAPVNLSKVKEGLTSITDNASDISHYELDRIGWLLRKGRWLLLEIAFSLLIGIAFLFFIVGGVVGILLEHWYHLIK
jgi:hypothetical protein